MVAHKCVLNFDTETVNTKEGPSKMVFEHLDKVCRITVAETITLLPNMVADIPCQIQEANGLDELVGVLEPSDKFTERYAVGAFRTAVTIKGGRVPVGVFNPSNQPIRIYRCSNIGNLHPLESEQELSQEGHTAVSYRIVSSGSSERDASVLPGVKWCSAVYMEDFENCCESMEELSQSIVSRCLTRKKRRH
ncbi:hypothetical protein OS493_021618 [Desmophyllum pertusum]|uniref:Uncharacterized protein n=1 Tax=Desmophyllum pertusum TaxID=174260 RepID=A0A9W9YAV7_9CNID|nr:hypothetical protein OS493_021618 [Desmophyllum pertusum]